MSSIKLKDAIVSAVSPLLIITVNSNQNTGNNVYSNKVFIVEVFSDYKLIDITYRQGYSEKKQRFKCINTSQSLKIPQNFTLSK